MSMTVVAYDKLQLVQIYLNKCKTLPYAQFSIIIYIIYYFKIFVNIKSNNKVFLVIFC